MSVDEIAGELDRLMGKKKWKQAEELLRSRRRTAAERGERAAELSLCSEQMGFYRMRGAEESFFEAWDRARSLLEELRPDAAARGTVLINGATGMVAFGEARAALPYYEQAMACYRRALAPGDPRFAALLNNMAFACEGCGDFPRAERCVLQAGEILAALPHHPDLGTNYVNLAQLYARRDPDDPRIGTCLDRAMAAFDDPETVWDGYYAHTARKCAGGFAALGREAEARDLRERADLIYAGT